MSGIAAGAATFAVVVAVWSAVVALRGRGHATLGSGLLALELAMVVLAASHLLAAGGLPGAKQAGYLVVGVLLLPLLLVCAGDEDRARPVMAAVGSAALAVVVLRIEVVL